MKEQQIRTILNHAQIYASRNLWRNLRISVKTRRDIDIIEMAIVNARSDINISKNAT